MVRALHWSADSRLNRVFLAADYCRCHVARLAQVHHRHILWNSQVRACKLAACRLRTLHHTGTKNSLSFAVRLVRLLLMVGRFWAAAAVPRRLWLSKCALRHDWAECVSVGGAAAEDPRRHCIGCRHLFLNALQLRSCLDSCLHTYLYFKFPTKPYLKFKIWRQS